MKYTPTIIRHFTAAMKLEIARLKKVHARVGDDWPAWFDPNDIFMYEQMVEWLAQLDPEEPEDDAVNSKPYAFMMEVVERYVQEHRDALTDHDINEITSFWKDYNEKKA